MKKRFLVLGLMALSFMAINVRALADEYYYTESYETDGGAIYQTYYYDEYSGDAGVSTTYFDDNTGEALNYTNYYDDNGYYEESTYYGY